MNFLEAILLGIIQGLTEFLPISSTGHLTITGKLLDLITTGEYHKWTAFIAVIQIGTLIAILFYFKNDLLKIAKSFIQENFIKPKKITEQEEDSRLGWLIVIGSLPVFTIGLLFDDIIEGAITKNLYVIAGSLIGLAVILWIAEKTGKFSREINQIKFWDALIIGLAQAVALIPGSSRSGTTITAGIFLGLKRETAARFSFLLSVPAILASGLYELYKTIPYLDMNDAFNIIIATAFSAVSGYLSIEFLLKYLKKKSTFVFILYRIILGIIIFILLNLQILSP